MSLILLGMPEQSCFLLFKYDEILIPEGYPFFFGIKLFPTNESSAFTFLESMNLERQFDISIDYDSCTCIDFLSTLKFQFTSNVMMHTQSKKQFCTNISRK